MNYRYVISDLDGTLLNEEGKISAYTLEVLRKVQAMGVGVVVASGRAVHSILPFARQIGTPLPLIANNGAIIADAETGVPLYTDCVSAEDAREVALFLEAGGHYFQCYDIGSQPHFYCEKNDPAADMYRKSTSMEPRPVGKLSEFIRKPTPKVLAIVPDEAMPGLRDQLKERYRGRLTVTNSTPNLIEITGLNVNKGAALRALCERLGATPADFIAFGDGGNDESMLTAAGLGVAMSNAHPSLLAVADQVCGSNAEDGLAHDLLQRLLG